MAQRLAAARGGSAFGVAAANPLRRSVPLQRRRGLACRAGLDAGAAAAVTQQALAFAVTLGAEGAFSLRNVPEGDKGRPSVPVVGAGVAGTVVAVGLVKAGGDGPLATVGLALGLLVAGAMLTASAQRAINLEYNDGDWPGPKAWPATMALISFFALSVFWQALFPILLGKS